MREGRPLPYGTLSVCDNVGEAFRLPSFWVIDCGRGDPSPTWIEGIPVGAIHESPVKEKYKRENGGRPMFHVKRAVAGSDG